MQSSNLQQSPTLKNFGNADVFFQGRESPESRHSRAGGNPSAEGAQMLITACTEITGDCVLYETGTNQRFPDFVTFAASLLAGFFD